MWEHFLIHILRCLDWLSCHIFVLVCVYIDITYSVTSIWRIESSCEWRSNHTVYTYCACSCRCVFYWTSIPTISNTHHSTNSTHSDSENVPLIRSKFAYCVPTTPLVKSCAKFLVQSFYRSLIYSISRYVCIGNTFTDTVLSCTNSLYKRTRHTKSSRSSDCIWGNRMEDDFTQAGFENVSISCHILNTPSTKKASPPEFTKRMTHSWSVIVAILARVYVTLPTHWRGMIEFVRSTDKSAACGFSTIWRPPSLRDDL